jgi:hypothetical protein
MKSCAKCGGKYTDKESLTRLCKFCKACKVRKVKALGRYLP